MSRFEFIVDGSDNDNDNPEYWGSTISAVRPRSRLSGLEDQRALLAARIARKSEKTRSSAPSEAHLIEAWFTHLQAVDVAAKYDTSTSVLYREWRALRALGKIPRGRRSVPSGPGSGVRRPREERVAASNKPSDETAVGRATAKLLALLVEHHGPMPRYDVHPSAR